MRLPLPRLEALLVTAMGMGAAALLIGKNPARLAGSFLGGATEDAFGTQWFYAFVGRALVRGDSPLRADSLYFPWGKDVLGHTGANLLDALVALPFRALLGPVTGYNLFVAVGLVASGLAFFLLAREHLRAPGLALAGGLLFATSPFVLHELAEGRPTQALLLLPPLLLLFLERLGEVSRWRAAILGGLLLGLLGHQYWYYGLFGSILVVAHALGGLPDARNRGPRLGAYGLLLLVAALLFLPLLLSLDPSLTDTEGVPGLLDLDALETRHEARSLMGAPLPLVAWQPWTGEAAQLRWSLERSLFEPRFLLRPPLLFLAGALGWLVRREGRGARGAVLFAMALLAVGPFLAWGASLISNPVYGLLLDLGLPFRRLWWPYRAFAFLEPMLLLGILSLVDRVPDGFRGRASRWGPLLRGLLLLSLMVGQVLHLRDAGLLPFPAWRADPPGGVLRLAASDLPAGAVVELPFGRSQVHLWHQAVHGRPILGGMQEHRQEFQPAEAVAFRRDNRFVAALIAAADTGALAPSDLDADRRALQALGYRLVLLDLEALQPAGAGGRPPSEALRRASLRGPLDALTAMLGAPLASDARSLLWDLGGVGEADRVPPGE